MKYIIEVEINGDDMSLDIPNMGDTNLYPVVAANILIAAVQAKVICCHGHAIENFNTAYRDMMEDGSVEIIEHAMQ